jgi:branched-chain amino acid transport system substrate-binding protein
MSSPLGTASLPNNCSVETFGLHVDRLSLGLVVIIAFTMLKNREEIMSIASPLKRSVAAAACLAALGAFPAHAAAPYKVNVILPLTGGAAFLGKGEQQALRLLQATVNKEGGIDGQPLEFAYYDDQTNPEVTVQITDSILPEKPAVMLGSSIVAMCKAEAPLLANGPFDYCLSPGVHPAEGSYQYSSSVDTHALIEALVRYFRNTGKTRLAFMTSTDATGQDAERGLNEILKLPENSGIKVVAQEHFNPNDVSVSAQIERIKAANPQAFIAWSTGAPIATVLRGAYQAGLNVPIATTNGNQTYAQMKQYKSFLPKTLYIPTSAFLPQTGLNPQVEAQQHKFYAAFKAAHLKPDSMSMLAWDPASIVVATLRKLGTKATASQFKAYISSQTDLPGINGIYNFKAVPQRGLTVTNAVVTRWNAKAGTWVAVSKPAGAPLK